MVAKGQAAIYPSTVAKGKMTPFTSTFLVLFLDIARFPSLFSLRSFSTSTQPPHLPSTQQHISSHTAPQNTPQLTTHIRPTLMSETSDSSTLPLQDDIPDLPEEDSTAAKEESPAASVTLISLNPAFKPIALLGRKTILGRNPGTRHCCLIWSLSLRTLQEEASLTSFSPLLESFTSFLTLPFPFTK